MDFKIGRRKFWTAGVFARRMILGISIFKTHPSDSQQQACSPTKIIREPFTLNDSPMTSNRSELFKVFL